MVVEIELSKTGKLAGKHVVVIDDIDADLAKVGWQAHECKTTTYAYRTGEQRMHRIILERILGRSLEKKEVPDHIDGNGLNNVRSNLRLATHQQNMINRRLPNGGFQGVRKLYKSYAAFLAGKRLGVYASPEHAHIVWFIEAREIYGEFANLDERALVWLNSLCK